MKKFSVVLILLFAILACKTLQPGSDLQPTGDIPPTNEVQSNGGNTPSDWQYIYEIPTDPVKVATTLDSATQAEATISTAGGTLTATGPDGTVYQLDIPADALLSDTVIRMTPVSQIEGMPFGSAAFAVQFEPDGLQLYKNAILTITPSQEIPPDQQIMFGYQNQGDNLVLLPPAENSAEIKIIIMHFSGAGVSKGFLADIEPVRARIGGDAEARIKSAIAEYLQKERQKQLLGQGDDEPLDLTGFFNEYEEQVVKPRVAAAGESCANARLAIQTVLSFERQKQLLGMGNDDEAVIDAGLMDTATNVCMKEEYELCRDEHIIHRIIPAWLGVERQYQLMGIEASPALDQAQAYVRQCLTFELDFQSEASMDAGGGDGYDSSVEAKVKLQFNPDDFSIKGTAPLVNTAFEFRAKDCSVESVRGGDTFTVNSLTFTSETSSPTDELGHVLDFKMIYYPGDTRETFTISCPDSPPYTSPVMPMWTAIFLPSHEGEMSEAEGGYIAENWEIFGDEYFAKIEWIKETVPGTVEAGTFKLYHKPGG